MLVTLCQLLFAATILIAQPSPQAQPAPKETKAEAPDLKTRLDALDKKITAIKDLSAEFEQTKKTVLLKKPLISTGTVKLKGAKTRWETIKPHPTIMTIDASEVRVYYPDQKTVEVYPMQGDLARLGASPLPRMSTIREQFDIAEIKPADIDAKATGDLLAISLTPKTEALKEHVSKIRVLIDAATACARSVEITDPDGDLTTIVFKSIKLDSGISDKDVELLTPPGTTISRPLEGGAPNPDSKPEDKK